MKVVEFSKLLVYPQFCEANQTYVEVEESLKKKEKAFNEDIKEQKGMQNDLKGQFTSMELLLTVEKHEKQLPTTEEEIRLLQRDRRDACSTLRDLAKHVKTEAEGSTIILSNVHQYKFMMWYPKQMDIEIEAEPDDMMKIMAEINTSLEKPPVLRVLGRSTIGGRRTASVI
ncbi:hypothetical protein COLO4_04895 [Corchorus olitorius]|uniref:Uncharacterized protein n=1 Tax=Corchorus olitorius TaxID=93759 RepID=A0A1R3KSK4_9ROSI|nr:hypothetical protein COLO4_04895 [Corchorus olitorius]